MCQARGCGNKHCRVVAERRDVYGLPKQDEGSTMQQPSTPSTTAARAHGQGRPEACATVSTRRTSARNVARKKRTTRSRRWAGVWSIQFPMMAIKDIAPDEGRSYARVPHRLCHGRQEPVHRSLLPKRACAATRVPHEMDENDGRILGGFTLRYMLGNATGAV